MLNPFTPDFGHVPVCIAGRHELIQSMDRAFGQELRDPNLTTLLVGARGTGKTILLTALSNLAAQNGWLSLNVTALAGMQDELLDQIENQARQFIDFQEARKRTQINLGKLASISWQNIIKQPKSWRTKMTQIIEKLNECAIGVLITIDEVNPDLDEMIQLTAAYQHFIREDRKVALLMAGLPFRVSNLLRDQSVSFLRRANQYHLRPIETYEVREALIETVKDGGKDISADAVDVAASAIEGFPYMLQLVGYRFWEVSGDNRVIDLPAVERGIDLARNDFTYRILDPTLDDLSEGDVRFLAAMLVDEKGSVPAELAKRLGKSSSYVSTYRKRLLEQGVIETNGRDKLRFALPMLRKYLPEYIEEKL